MHWQSKLLASLCIVAAAAACNPPTERIGDRDNNNNGASGTRVLSMRAGSDGTFSSCEADGDCTSIANPEGCDTLVIEVDVATGATCETCEAADGSVISHGGAGCGDCATGAAATDCRDPSVECVVFTAPEPDCVVCAHVGGDVIYNDCTVARPTDCDVFTDAAGIPCETCYDAAGNVTYSDCRTDCSMVVCPSVACAPGFAAVRLPGECCAICEPIDDCSSVYCPMMAPMPDCPPDSILVRYPGDCCSYYCEPLGCSGSATSPSGAPGMMPPDMPCATDADCGIDGRCDVTTGLCVFPDPAGCPPGFEMRYEEPYCGSCVPVDTARYCYADADCFAGEICSIGTECLADPACGCVTSCDAAGICETMCADCPPCAGICRPADVVCPTYPPPPYECLGGFWDTPGRSADGCPLPPVCVCYDGSIALDGLCRTDSCAGVMCPMVVEICPPGEHLEYGYPYCCGVCVPDAECWTAAGFADPCALIDCAPGSHCEVGARCEGICVPDPIRCMASAECPTGTFCSTEIGDCGMLPGTCDPATGCTTACVGECIPGEPPSARTMCASTLECAAGEICTTEWGDCAMPPHCVDPTVPCTDVCYGYCAPETPPPPPPANCMSTADCAMGETCTTEWGDCLPPPDCLDPAMGCAGVCYGFCVVDTPPPPPPTGDCLTTADCAAGDTCTTEWGDCLPPPGCDPTTGMGCTATAECWGVCVTDTPPPPPPPPPPNCTSTADCFMGETCTTEWGDCLPPPDCVDPTLPCAAVCYGYCAPPPPPPSTPCASSAECAADEICTTELGECLPPPGCAPGTICPTVCYGTCEPLTGSGGGSTGTPPPAP